MKFDICYHINYVSEVFMYMYVPVLQWDCAQSFTLLVGRLFQSCDMVL